MLELGFSGWFQCRLATDPDPHDEPRGVSGYVKAYVGEPDLDRVLRFHSPPFERTHGPPIGVVVNAVIVNGVQTPDHALLGAAVDILDQPKFEGRNGVIADDGYEPIFPFLLDVSTSKLRVTRGVLPENPEDPFEGLYARGVEGGVAILEEINRLTGYSSGLLPVWRNRLSVIQAEASETSPSLLPGLRERIKFLSSSLANPPGAARFFGARMRYEYALKSSSHVQDPEEVLGALDTAAPWKASFWLGGWDADVLCGFANGTLSIPLVGDPPQVFGERLRRP